MIRQSSVIGSSLVGDRSRTVGGLALIPDISNIARVSISHIIGDNLGAAIGKSNMVLAVGGVVVTGLVGAKVGARVVIVHSIGILVDSRTIIRGLMVGSRLVGGSRSVVGRGMDGSLVGGGMDNRGLVGGAVKRGRPVDRGRLVGRGRVVDGGRLVSGGSVVSGGVDGNVGRGVSSSGVLLLVVGLVHLIGLGRGLAHNLGVVGAVGLVHGGVDSGGIALLDGLMGGLVGGSKGQEGEDSNESLEQLCM